MKMKEKNILQPKQKRGIATKKKIKKAAKELIAKSGYYTITSNMIAAEAHVPIGSFYNYFGNKKSLMLELIKDWNLEYHDHALYHFPMIIKELNSDEDIQGNLEKLLEKFALSEMLSSPIYKIIHSLQFTEPDVLALSEEIRSVEMKILCEYLERINDLHPVDNIPIKAKLIHSTVENITLYIHHLGTTFEKKQLLKETAKMLYGYLLLDKK